MVLHVAGGKDPGDAGRGGEPLPAAAGDDVAVLHRQLPGEQLGVGGMADGDEETLGGDLLLATGLLLRHDPGDSGVIAQHLVDLGIEHQADLAFRDALHQLVLHDFLGAELVAPVHELHAFGDVGEVERLLHGGVAAADHHHVLTLVEEAIAGGAGRDAAPHELLLRGQAEVFGRCAGGDDQRVAGVGRGVALEDERPRAQLHRLDVVDDQLGVETLGVALEALHQVRPLDAVGVGRPVVDVGGGHQLAALRDTGNQHRLEVGARGVDRGAVTGGTGAQDQKLDVARGHARQLERQDGSRIIIGTRRQFSLWRRRSRRRC